MGSCLDISTWFRYFNLIFTYYYLLKTEYWIPMWISGLEKTKPSPPNLSRIFAKHIYSIYNYCSDVLNRFITFNSIIFSFLIFKWNWDCILTKGRHYMQLRKLNIVKLLVAVTKVIFGPKLLDLIKYCYFVIIWKTKRSSWRLSC